MKNKILNFILVLCLIIPSMFMLSACNMSDETNNALQKSIDELTQEIVDLNDKITDLETKLDNVSTENNQSVEQLKMIDTAWALYSQARSDFFFNTNGVRNNLKIEGEDETSLFSYSYYYDDVAGYLFLDQYDQKASFDDPWHEINLFYQKQDNTHRYIERGEEIPYSQIKKTYNYSKLEGFINLDFDYIALTFGDEPFFNMLPALTKSNIASVVKTNNGYKIRFEFYNTTKDTKTMIVLEKEISLDAKLLNETIDILEAGKDSYEMGGETIIEGYFGQLLNISLVYNYGGVDAEEILAVYNKAINYV